MKSISFLTILLLVLVSCGQTGKDSSEEKENTADEVHTSEAETDFTTHPGFDLYNQHCLVCHQADGMGVPGMNPPLVRTKWVDGPNEELIAIVLHGMNEEIEIDGSFYEMPMAGLPHLSDQEIVDILNYVRARFGSSDPQISIEEVQKVRKEG